MPKVSIYTTPTCVYCRAAKDFFREHNISYEEHNVATDLPRREEMIAKSGQMGVPVILITKDGATEPEVIVGFDEARLSELLGVS